MCVRVFVCVCEICVGAEHSVCKNKKQMYVTLYRKYFLVNSGRGGGP